MTYFPEAHTNENELEVELDLSNYATKSDLKIRQALIHHNLLKNMI